MLGIAATPLTAANGGNIGVGDGALQSIAGAAAGNVAVGYQALTSSTINGGNPNTAIGMNAMQYATTGTNNTAIGNTAMQGTSTAPMTGAGHNVAVGDSALYDIQGATIADTALGYEALEYNSTGGSNTALGYAVMAGVSVTPLTGANNTGVGSLALLSAQGAAANNTALGYDALTSNATGTDSTAVGSQALYSATGSPNDALGYEAGLYISTGSSNVAIGYTAMQGVSATPLTGNGNTAVGNSALLKAQGAAVSNTAVGQGSLVSNTSGNQNTAVGESALNDITTGTNSSALGVNALYSATGSPNDAFGEDAGEYITTSTDNVAIGFETMQGVSATPLTGAGWNTAVGDTALAAIQGAATFNTALGAAALISNTTGSNNTALGVDALRLNTTGSTSTAVGTYSLYSNTGAGPNDGLGYYAGYYISTGANNVAIGYTAMQGVAATPLTGSSNVAVGTSALASAQGAAASNTALGYEAGYSSHALTTGSSDVYIGYEADQYQRNRARGVRDRQRLQHRHARQQLDPRRLSLWRGIFCKRELLHRFYARIAEREYNLHLASRRSHRRQRLCAEQHLVRHHVLDRQWRRWRHGALQHHGGDGDQHDPQHHRGAGMGMGADRPDGHDLR